MVDSYPEEEDQREEGRTYDEKARDHALSYL
jgi:hypothetical protein